MKMFLPGKAGGLVLALLHVLSSFHPCQAAGYGEPCNSDYDCDGVLLFCYTDTSTSPSTQTCQGGGNYGDMCQDFRYDCTEGSCFGTCREWNGGLLKVMDSQISTQCVEGGSIGVYCWIYRKEQHHHYDEFTGGLYARGVGCIRAYESQAGYKSIETVTCGGALTDEQKWSYDNLNRFESIKYPGWCLEMYDYNEGSGLDRSYVLGLRICSGSNPSQVFNIGSVTSPCQLASCNYCSVDSDCGEDELCHDEDRSSSDPESKWCVERSEEGEGCINDNYCNEASYLSCHDGTCQGGGEPGDVCKADNHCDTSFLGGYNFCIDNTCQGGGEPGDICTTDSHCDTSFLGGYNFCIDNTCQGGAEPGDACTADSHCDTRFLGGYNFCIDNTCQGGGEHGDVCKNDNHCQGDSLVFCDQWNGICQTAGGNLGDQCRSDDHCNEGTSSCWGTCEDWLGGSIRNQGSSKCMGLDGALAKTRNCADNDQQTWHSDVLGTGTIRNKHKKGCLTAAYVGDQLLVKPCDGNELQLWHVDSRDRVHSNWNANKCIRMYSTSNVAVRLQWCDDDDDQKYTIASETTQSPSLSPSSSASPSMAPTDSPSMAPSFSPPSEFGNIKVNNKCLKMLDHTDPRMVKAIDSCTGSYRLLWSHDPSTNRLKNRHHKRCLEVDTGEGGGYRYNVIANGCGSGQEQKWYMDMAGRMRSYRYEHKCLEKQDDGYLHVNHCGDGTNQQFTVPDDYQANFFADHYGWGVLRVKSHSEERSNAGYTECIQMDMSTQDVNSVECDWLDHQMWTYHPSTKQLKNKANDQCLTLLDDNGTGRATVSPDCSIGDSSYMWSLDSQNRLTNDAFPEDCLTRIDDKEFAFKMTPCDPNGSDDTQEFFLDSDMGFLYATV